MQSNISVANEENGLFFEQEKIQVEKDDGLNQIVETEGEISPNGEILLVDNPCVGEKITESRYQTAGINVIYINGDKPNFCIITSPYQYGMGKWLDNRYFIYHYGKADVYVYDLLYNKEKRISHASLHIKSVDNGYILLMSNFEGDFIITYEFDENGEVIFANEDGTVLDVGDWEDGRVVWLSQ